MRYLSSRHQRLMDESELALEEATHSPSPRIARIASHVLTDAKVHRIWESCHAEWVRPIAEANRRTPQVIGLRQIEVRLTHRRALIDYIRKHKVRGTRRDRLFKAFYGPREMRDAILKEHRDYMIAVSSNISTDHLIEVMHDPTSYELLRMYEAAYTQYFELFCFVQASADSSVIEAVRGAMGDVAARAKRLRTRLQAVQPDPDYSSFDRQAQLARSGRYPVLNYQNR